MKRVYCTPTVWNAAMDTAPLLMGSIYFYRGSMNQAVGEKEYWVTAEESFVEAFRPVGEESEEEKE